MDISDATIKTLVCDACWSGIFSADGWQTVLAAKQVPGRWGYSKGYSYRTTWEAVHAAADRCSWCRSLHRRGSMDGDLEVWAACDENSQCTPAGEKKLTVVVYCDTGVQSTRRYLMYTSSDDKAAEYIAARERITNVMSPESFKLALECFSNCVRTHDECPQPKPALLPDRVIDCSDTKKPKIIVTGGNQYGFYVALSYVWGGPQPMTTTTNIDEYVREGLDMQKFPQTIQDAVVVTHNIGQRYLWIDALCILQDSSKDKARQLGAMRSIYRNAYLTINAACASSTNEGF